MNNKMKIEFLSKSANESFARVVSSAFASQLDPTIEEISDIKTSVSEAVTNAIVHGYGDKEGIITMECVIADNTITISVSDNGRGIEDIKKAREPMFTTAPNMERSGMGFAVMESFMDTLTVESIVGVGTKVTMSKAIKNNR